MSSISITSPASGAKVTGTFPVTISSVQTVNGTDLPAQSITLTGSTTGTLPAAPLTVLASNSSGDTTSLALVCADESADNTTVANNSGTLVDASQAFWNIVGGLVKKDGVQQVTHSPAPLATLLYYGHTIYAFNGTTWYQSGASWTALARDPRIPPESADGTTGASVVDATGNTFTVSGGVVSVNGTPDTNTSNIAYLLYYGHNVYATNAVGGWIMRIGSTWNPAEDPRLTESADGTTGSPIVDASLALWTVTGGVVYKDGSAAGTSSSVTLLLYSGHKVYQQNAPGNWWYWDGATWQATHDPRLTESADGTTGASVVGADKTLYTINSGGLVFADGTSTGQTAATLLYYAHTVYAQTSTGAWAKFAAGTWSTSHDPRLTESADGTTIPSSTGIVDASLALWTLSGAKVYSDGQAVGYTNQVALMLYYAHTVYQKNTAGNWWKFVGGVWVATTDPRVITPSAQDASIPPLTQLTDSLGNVWTIVSGAVYMNGVAAGSTHSVTELVYHNSKVFQHGTAWYYWNVNATGGPAWASYPAGDPRGVAQKRFYGVNGHDLYTAGTWAVANQPAHVTLLQDLGATIYRVDSASAGNTNDQANTLATALSTGGAFYGKGIQVLPVIQPIPSGGFDPFGAKGVSGGGTQAQGYDFGYGLGYRHATVLNGKCTHIECGNELDDVFGKKSGTNGYYESDWNMAGFKYVAAVIKGMVDGIKAVNPAIQCGVGTGGPLSFAVLNMWAAGRCPDGTTDPSWAVPWDFTCCHWYSTYGNIENAGYTGYAPLINVAQQLENLGKPIWLTEFGWNGTGSSADSDSTAASTLTTMMTNFKRIQATYGIKVMIHYALINDTNTTFGLTVDGVTTKLPYGNYKSFVSANPMTI